MRAGTNVANAAIDRTQRRCRRIGEEGAHEDARFSVATGEPTGDRKGQGQCDHEIRLGPGPETRQYAAQIARCMWQERHVGAGIEQHHHMGEAQHGIEQDKLPSFEAALFGVGQQSMSYRIT